MNWLSATNHGPERYYLFAGMGGKAAVRKQREFLLWAVVAGLLVSGILAATLYWVETGGKPLL